jgi:hypothetical protein
VVSSHYMLSQILYSIAFSHKLFILDWIKITMFRRMFTSAKPFTNSSLENSFTSIIIFLIF